MSRRRAAVKRVILPDAKYKDHILAKFINNLMERGKKSVAETIVYGAIKDAESKLKREGLEIFLEAVKSVRPIIEVRSRRVGGATYQVPVEIRETRSIALALRWIIGAAKKRSERTMRGRLAAELIDISNNRGAALKKREDTHKMAEANKAFSHLRF
jgi:small subunit ribosomal protein S7